MRRGFVGASQPVLQTQTVDQGHRGGLLVQKPVGSTFDHEAFTEFGGDLAAELLLGLVNDDPKGTAGFGGETTHRVRRGQTGNAAADDRDRFGRTHAVGTRLRPSRCTSSTKAAMCSGGVSGNMPWPRLKMCPRQPWASFNTR